jgi:hypothetical protein
MLRLLVVVVLISVMAQGANACAMSCRKRDDRFLFDCREKECVPLFRARDTPTADSGRRLVVETFPQWAVGPVSELARASGDTGVLEITFASRYYASLASRSHLEKGQRSFQPKVTRLDVDPAAARREYERRAADEGLRWATIESVSAKIALLKGGLLLFAIFLTSRACRTNRVRLFVWALSIPALMFTVTWVAYPLFIHSYSGLLGIFFAPLVAACTVLAWVTSLLARWIRTLAIRKRCSRFCLPSPVCASISGLWHAVGNSSASAATAWRSICLGEGTCGPTWSSN